MDIHFKNSDLQLLSWILHQSILAHKEQLKAKRIRVEQRDMRDRIRSEELLQKQRSQLFHVFTLGIFIHTPDPHASALDAHFKELRFSRFQKRIDRLETLLMGAQAAQRLGNGIYLRVEDIAEMDFDYWKEQWDAANKRNSGLMHD